MVTVNVEHAPVSTAAVQLAGWLDAADHVERLARDWADDPVSGTFRLIAAELRATGESELAADAARERFLIGATAA